MMLTGSKRHLQKIVSRRKACICHAVLLCHILVGTDGAKKPSKLFTMHNPDPPASASSSSSLLRLDLEEDEVGFSTTKRSSLSSSSLFAGTDSGPKIKLEPFFNMISSFSSLAFGGREKFSPSYQALQDSLTNAQEVTGPKNKSKSKKKKKKVEEEVFLPVPLPEPLVLLSHSPSVPGEEGGSLPPPSNRTNPRGLPDGEEEESPVGGGGERPHRVNIPPGYATPKPPPLGIPPTRPRPHNHHHHHHHNFHYPNDPNGLGGASHYHINVVPSPTLSAQSVVGAVGISQKIFTPMDSFELFYKEYKILVWGSFFLITSLALLCVLVFLYINSPPTEVVTARGEEGAGIMSNPQILKFLSTLRRDWDEWGGGGTGRKKRKAYNHNKGRRTEKGTPPPPTS